MLLVKLLRSKPILDNVLVKPSAPPRASETIIYIFAHPDNGYLYNRGNRESRTLAKVKKGDTIKVLDQRCVFLSLSP